MPVPSGGVDIVREAHIRNNRSTDVDIRIKMVSSGIIFESSHAEIDYAYLIRTEKSTRRTG